MKPKVKNILSEEYFEVMVFNSFLTDLLNITLFELRLFTFKF